MSRIERLIAATGLGPIEHDSSAIQFSDLTVFYGENARGKSTLAMALRAARDHDRTAMLEKTRPDTDVQPSFRLKYENRPSPIQFDGTQWSGKIENISIFDAHFVHTHVYKGAAVERDQRTALYSFALGSTAVELTKRVDTYTALIDKCRREISSLQDELDGHRGSIELNEFLQLDKEENLSEELEQVEDEIKRAQEASTLAQLSLPTTPSPTAQIDLSEIRLVLEQSADAIVISAAERAEKELDSLGPGARDWIRKGLDRYLGEGESCPLCGRERGGQDDLISVFLYYFGDAYRALHSDVEETKTTIEDAIGREAQTSWERTANQAIRDAARWQPYGLDALDVPEIEVVTGAFGDAYNALIGLIEKKLEDPLRPIEWPKEEKSPKERVEALRKLTDEFESSVETYRERASQIQEKVSEADVGALKHKLKVLQVQKVRWENDRVKACCDKVIRRKKLKLWLDKRKKTVRDNLRGKADNIWREYAKEINKYLARFDCAFRLANPKSEFRGTAPSAQFEFELDGRSIAVTDSGDSYHFGNTFSEGDKTTLALALFLARIEQTSDLADAVVVFDDPCTSLGLHRRSQTLDAIIEIIEKAQQVVLLTHDPHFARDLVRRHYGVKAFTYELRRKGRYSEIEDVDLEKLTRTEYLKHAEKIRTYIATGDGDRLEVARSIRPFLERNLHLRAPHIFPSGKYLGGYLKIIREADDTGEPAERWMSVYDDLNSINGFTNRYHHGNDSSRPSDGELRSYSQQALAVAEGLGM